MIDDNYRDYSDDNPVKAAWNQIKSNLPFLSMTLPGKYDGFGNEQLRYDNGVLGFFNTFVNPGKVTQIHPNEMASYVDEISAATGNKSIYPESKAPANFTYTGSDGVKQTVTISGESMTETYQQTYGQNVSRLYGELMEMDGFGSLPAEQQAKVLTNAKSYATQLARSSVSDYNEVPAYITNRPEGMSEAEAILRQTVSGTSTKYTDLPIDVAALVAETLKDLPKETKPDGTHYTQVRDIQKMEAVAANDDLDPYLELILPAYMEQSQQQRYQKALDKGYTSDQFVAGYRVYLDRDDDTAKMRQIQQMAAELGISYQSAKTLWEIYAQRIEQEKN
jgi:hypothetical protein